MNGKAVRDAITREAGLPPVYPHGDPGPRSHDEREPDSDALVREREPDLDALEREADPRATSAFWRGRRTWQPE